MSEVVPHVEHVELDRLAPGHTHRMWLDLMTNALGSPVSLPVLVARGTRDGPVALVTCAVHGNEINGIPVIHRLFAKLDSEKLKGTVIAVPVVNVEGFHLHQRRTVEGFDLNHMFPGVPDGNFTQVFAYRFLHRVVRQADFLMDLHTASEGRANSLYVRANMTHPGIARMAYLQRPQIIVHNPPSDGTLRGAAEGYGVEAITVEIGDPSRFQREMIQRTTVGIRAVLAERGMIARRSMAMGERPVICERSAWMYTDAGGLLEVLPTVTDRVKAGEPVAHLVDAFGERVRTYTAPEDGVVIGHSVDPVAQSGARILHLGTVAAEHHPFEERTA